MWEVTIGEVIDKDTCWEWKSTAYMENSIKIVLEEKKR